MRLPIHFSRGGAREGWGGRNQCQLCKEPDKPRVSKLSKRFNTKRWNTIQLRAHAAKLRRPCWHYLGLIHPSGSAFLVNVNRTQWLTKKAFEILGHVTFALVVAFLIRDYGFPFVVKTVKVPAPTCGK